ncbi:MAG TPA: sugar phosphate nucleotidyltransferase, partial [Verrucomicrobiota bacterium]|nr:sugar phosphate nucleotidyltransferase [Verrucomicrobiota bacterium]
MEVQRAVITAAGRSQRSLPLQTLVDADGVTKTALQIILEEALAAGVEEVGVVVAPGDGPAFAAGAGPHAKRLRFLEQAEPRGYGHAVWTARDFTGGQPFLLLVGDHVYLSRTEARCAAQLVRVARQADAAVSAVQPTHEGKLPYYGAVGGRRLAGAADVYEVADVLEKPTPTEAEQRLVVPGLRAGHYLCFFGMHVLTPAVMELLDELLRVAAGPVHLSTALARLARREKYLAAEIAGRRHDLG